jgi:hypothetical protein
MPLLKLLVFLHQPLQSTCEKGSDNALKVAITTVDNPYNPFTQFTSWFLFDVGKGYNTCGHLARIAKTSDAFSDKENDEEIESAIDEMIELDFMNIYKKVKSVS